MIICRSYSRPLTFPLTYVTWPHIFYRILSKFLLVGSQCYVMFIMDDSGIHSVAWHYSDCAFVWHCSSEVWHRSLALALAPVNTNIPRLCTELVKSEDSKILMLIILIIIFYLYVDKSNELFSFIAIYNDQILANRLLTIY